MLLDEKRSSYPLRQPLFPGALGLPIFERPGVVDWMSRPDRYLVVCEGRGGRIYATEERALHEAQQVIRDAHGAEVVFRQPEIPTYLDTERDSWLEPVMFVRIKCPHADARNILKELNRREVKIFETDMQRYDLVVRAEGPLARLLGLTQAVASVAQGRASIWTWLDSYQHLPPQKQTGARQRPASSCKETGP